MAKKCGKDTFILFAQLPNLDNLSSLNLSLANELQERSGEHIYTIVIWKCRELLFTEDKVLAAPSPAAKSIEVVVPKNLVRDESFLSFLESLTLQIVNVTDVVESVFKRCLSYTIAAKLAPEWNKVGNYYVQGRNFLSCGNVTSALSLEININKSQLYLVPTFVTFKLPIMKLDNLGICSNILASFNEKKSLEIDRSSLEIFWCHVLPSLKKGVIDSITHSIPHNSLFKSFDELKSYWKNTYGYRIPEPDGSTLFYNLRFFWMNNVVFTYPSFCILPFKPIATPQITDLAFESHSQFRMDIQRRMPFICEVPWLKAEEPLMKLTANFSSASTQPSEIPDNLEQVFQATKPVKNASNASDIQVLVNVSQKRDVLFLGELFRRPEKALRVIPTFRKTGEMAVGVKAAQKRRPLMALNDDDIAAFCRKGKLNKVKLELLAIWAREKGIQHHSRMRKSELVCRIEKFVLMNNAEP